MEDTDIFLWANQADAHKDELEIDLFFFTKGYVVYATNYSKELKAQLKVLFLYDMISAVQTGAATGMKIVDIHTSVEDDNIIGFTPIESVEHAQEVIEQIEYSDESALGIWNNGDHDLKKLKGIVARFKRKGSEPFYITKLLPNANILKGAISWELNGEKLQPMRSDVAMRVTPDNQVLATGKQLFIFSESKFARTFGYDPQKVVLLEDKIEQITSLFTLKFPEGLDLRTIIEGHSSLADKILRCDPTKATQEQLIEQSNEYNLALLYDENTLEIIIMDARDLTLFADLLNDDYVGSDMTGIRYVATKKKEMRDTEVSQLNTGL